jgi:predicted nucleotidyltransferase
MAHKAADMLKAEFGAQRVVLFGSVLYPELFHARSDIDLAAWGVQHYFTAVAHLLDLDPDFSFDLIPAEDARPGILELIEKEGLEL